MDLHDTISGGTATNLPPRLAVASRYNKIFAVIKRYGISFVFGVFQYQMITTREVWLFMNIIFPYTVHVETVALLKKQSK